MELTNEQIKKWQIIWHRVCALSFFRKDIVSQIIIDNQEDIKKYRSSRNFEEITLDYTWKFYSSLKDQNGNYIEPLVVPELEKIYVPHALFEALGVYAWFKYSFPNCVISFWED
jgi:hypothetical protein